MSRCPLLLTQSSARLEVLWYVVAVNKKRIIRARILSYPLVSSLLFLISILAFSLLPVSKQTTKYNTFARVGVSHVVVASPQLAGIYRVRLKYASSTLRLH